MLIDIDYGFFEDRVNIFEDFLLLLCCLQMTVGQIASVFTGDKFLHQEHLQFSFQNVVYILSYSHVNHCYFRALQKQSPK